MEHERLYHLLPDASRSKLDRLFYLEDYDKLGSIEGLRTVEPRYAEVDQATDYECWAYIFDRSNARKLGIQNIDKLKAEVLARPWSLPDKDSLIAYLGGDFAEWRGQLWRVPLHVGRVIDVGKDITVRSKFGVLDVYEHPINVVPNVYGNYAKFVNIPGLFEGH